MTIPNQVIAFAGGEANLAPYKMFEDYFKHYSYNSGNKKLEGQFQTSVMTPEGKSVSISFAEKEDKMNAALKREILRVAGIQNISDFPLETWANHPALKWATFAVVSAMIDLVLPSTIIDSIGLYSDVRTIGWGDSASFDVTPRDLFAVSKVGRSKRTTELKKAYNGQVVVFPEPREMTVFVSLMKVLAGKESLADVVVRMTRSFETTLAYEVYDLFATTMGSLTSGSSTGLLLAGYTQQALVHFCQTVAAWNGGAKAIVIGTQSALQYVLPDNSNFRFDLDNSNYVKLGYITSFAGADIMMLPQVADYTKPFGLKLADNKIWIISPSAQKLVKVVLEGSVLSYTNDAYQNANLLQSSTMIKSWGSAIATNSVAAQMTVS